MSLCYRKGHTLLVSLALYAIGLQATDITQCFADIVSCAENSSSPNCTSTVNISSADAFSLLRTSNGSSPGTIQAATAISYAGCVQMCGRRPGPFNWNEFSQEYSAWLLPYLALLSQLPFGARRRVDNLMSTVLTLGSPTLAGYSLYLTLLNARWVNDRLFANIHYPSAAVRLSVVRALSGLQQVPLRVHPGEGGQLESLVVHPDNDEWWTTFTQELDSSYTWSIASAMNVIWVIIAYLLTVIYSMSNIAQNLNSNGEGTGSGWLWLLPVVVGWLILSPKCDYGRVLEAYDKANKKAFVADTRDPTGAPTRTHVTSNFGLTVTANPVDWEQRADIISPDECRIPPIFNYARVWLWARNVYVISLLYCAASEKSNRRVGVDGEPISGSVRNDVPRESRIGNCEQTIQYCLPANHRYPGSSVLFPRGMFCNMIVASLMALQLQWGTACAAVLIVWFTPTIGLGCRSLVYLLYGVLSTIVWVLLVLSSILGYYAHHLSNNPPASTSDVENTEMRPLSTPPYPKSTTESSLAGNSPRLISNVITLLGEVRVPDGDTANPSLDGPATPSLHDRHEQERATSTAPIKRVHTLRARMIAGLADWLRWIGKTIAIINAISTIANSILQYAGVYNNCFCDSSMFTWGRRGFAVVAPSSGDLGLVESAWIGAVALALSCCGVFVGSIYLMRDSLPW